MPIWKFDPAGSYFAVCDAMGRLMDDPRFVPTRLMHSLGREFEHEFRLPVAVYSTPDEIVVQAAVPGLTPEDVEITLDGDRLTIACELKPPLENVEYVLQERPYGRFRRTLVLNVPVAEADAKATVENGLLTLVLPKAQEIRPRVIPIQQKISTKKS